jgi:transposase InsO family protein
VEGAWRAGEVVPRCQVRRLMAEHGIRGAKRRGKPWRTTTSDSAAGKRPNLVCQNFTAQAPNRLWVGDFTYLRCWEVLLPGLVRAAATVAGSRHDRGGAGIIDMRTDHRIKRHFYPEARVELAEDLESFAGALEGLAPVAH